MKKSSALTIWSFTGFLLMIYGIIITIMGIYYVIKPVTKMPLQNINPSLWWGIVLFVLGLIFNIGDRITRAK